jgi:hypothetical protein
MRKCLLLVYVFCGAIQMSAQTENDVLTIPLTQFAKDERFDKFQLTLALFLVQGDTILSYDYEGLIKPKILTIKKPAGYAAYAYGYVFFTGIYNPNNPGYLTALVCNPYHKNPKIIIDVNCDLDFTNDSVYNLPYYDNEPLYITLNNAAISDGNNQLLLTRNKLFGNKYDFKKYMDEYYAAMYKGRKFIGVEFTYREQRLQTRYGFVKFNDDSFKIALYDANANGLYNDGDTDRIIIINIKDSIFDASNPLGTYTINKAGKPTYFEKNGRYFELIEADSAGKFIKIKVTSNIPDAGNIKTGKKTPKVVFTLAEPNAKLKLKKLRKNQIYIYLANTSSRNFSADTFMLRQIAALDPEKLKVICVLYVNKTYYFKEFAHEANANYFVALGTKEVARKLGINSIPQSLWLNKRRRVIKYGIKPSEFIRNYTEWQLK